MTKVLVIGDVIEDLIVIPEESIRPNTDTKAKIQKSMGGQAANVASWIAHNGVSVSFVGCVGSADVVKLEQDLLAQGIESQLQSSSKPTGSLVVLVDGQSRSMLTDRGANQDLDLAKIDPAGFAVVYLSGYSLLGRSLEEVSEFATRVKIAGALLAIDPGFRTGCKTVVLDKNGSLIKETVIYPHNGQNLLLKSPVVFLLSQH